MQAHIGFNTSINGLGRNPDDVNITGGVWADAQWFGGNATQNFWRSMENLKITPFTGENRWAVSQAAPMRRIHVAGDLAVFPSSYGWASGGFTADSKVDGAMKSASQQQWYTRDSALGRWEGSVWNMVFSGVTGSPAPSFPNPSHTVLDTTPISREKPYLYLDGSSYAVFVPSARTNARGVSWPNTPGTSIPLSQFYVAKPGDTADRINAALAQGLHLLLTPGIYTLDKTIDVNRADTVVLGLGYATIVPTAGQTAMKVGDVNGVRIAGVLFDAGVTNSPAMLEVGSAGNHTDRAANPVSLHDVFVRVGGRIPGKVTSAIVVNSDDTIIDHIWSWRGDHGAGVGWNENPSAYGLVVNGNDVLGLGLFVEHYQKENTLWNGDRGRTIFYQNELPYDVPNQAAWQNGTRRGYAGYRVADAVTTHELWGGGVYSFFNVDPSIVVDSGFQVTGQAGGAVPQHPHRLARRQRRDRARHQRHRRRGAGHGHDPVVPGQLRRLTDRRATAPAPLRAGAVVVSHPAPRDSFVAPSTCTGVPQVEVRLTGTRGYVDAGAGPPPRGGRVRPRHPRLRVPQRVRQRGAHAAQRRQDHHGRPVRRDGLRVARLLPRRAAGARLARRPVGARAASRRTATGSRSCSPSACGTRSSPGPPPSSSPGPCTPTTRPGCSRASRAGPRRRSSPG